MYMYIHKHKSCLTPVKDDRKQTMQVSSFAYAIYNKSRFEAKTTKIFI